MNGVDLSSAHLVKSKQNRLNSFHFRGVWTIVANKCSRLPRLRQLAPGHSAHLLLGRQRRQKWQQRLRHELLVLLVLREVGRRWQRRLRLLPDWWSSGCQIRRGLTVAAQRFATHVSASRCEVGGPSESGWGLRLRLRLRQCHCRRSRRRHRFSLSHSFGDCRHDSREFILFHLPSITPHHEGLTSNVALCG